MSLIAFSALNALSGVAFALGDADHGKSGARHKGHASALGNPGDPKKVSRTVEITMSDAMRFTPASITAERNETIRFVLKNDGRLKHEMVLGTIKELKEHAALMLKFPEMEHADPNQASVEPGKTGELIWRFTRAGTFDFACLQAGHYEAGMKGQVMVAATAAPLKSSISMAAVAFAPAVAFAAVPPAASQTAGGGTMVLTQAGTGDMTEGEIRKVDKDTKKITIKHGEIKNLDMPGMTMLFQVKDPAMLEMVKPGDKVKFRAEKAGGGIVLTEIQVAR